MKKFVSVARHGIKQSFPNLSTQQEVEDMNVILDVIETEEIQESEPETESNPELTPAEPGNVNSEPDVEA